MANIISIGTALPQYCHPQMDILKFMQTAYNLDETDKRKLSFLYSHSGIQNRYSVINDFSKDLKDWTFIPTDQQGGTTPIEKRLQVYNDEALPISVEAIKNCIEGHMLTSEITHLITVSCTGMSAPGLDLQITEALNLSPDIYRTSVNFMGCYAAIHALKMAQMICNSQHANVIIVATELCTLHFQQEYTLDNASSSLLFSDGSAAVLISNKENATENLSLKNFYSQVSTKGKNDMAWQISSKGFLMTLSSYIPQLIQEDICVLVDNALVKAGLTREDVTHWCIHPGGKKIIDVIKKQLNLSDDDVAFSSSVLAKYGNMSSTTILFVLKEIIESITEKDAVIFGVAFGPGLTMETFIASNK